MKRVQLDFSSENFAKNLKSTKIMFKDVDVFIDINDLDNEKIDWIFKRHKKTRILIKNSSFDLTKENVEKLQKASEYIKNNYKKETLFANSVNTEEGWSIEKVFSATSKLEEWAKEINDARVNDRGYKRKLSPYEKFLYAYQIVTQFEYKESQDKKDARDIVRIINNNFQDIVCVGYASLLSALCKLIGIECVTQNVIVLKKEMPLTPNHENCCVKIQDYRYRIDGIYYCDPCWDSRKGEIKSTYHHAHIKFSEVNLVMKGNVFVCGNSLRTQLADEAKKLGCLNKAGGVGYIDEDGKIEAGRKNNEQWRKTERVDEECVSYVSKKLIEDLTTLRNSWGVEKPNEEDYIGKPYFVELLVNGLALKWLENKVEKNQEGVLSKNFFQFLYSPMIEKFLNEYSKESEEYIKRNVRSIIKLSGFDKLEINDSLLSWAEKRNNPTKITQEMFVKALGNVFVARGRSREDAEDEVKDRFEAGVEFCKKRMGLWAESENLFIEEAYNRILERQNEIE